MKAFLKALDAAIGAPLRAFLRYCLAYPLVSLCYKVTIEGVEDAVSCKNGAIVVSNHQSLVDGLFLTSIAWPLARLRPVAWHAEYSRPFLLPFMKLFGAISVGSPKHLPQVERERRTEKSIAIMNKVLNAGHALLIFCEGGLGDGKRVSIMPKLHGVYDLIRAHPDKPVVLVKIDGLQYSQLSRTKLPHCPWYRRLPVHVTIRRFDRVLLDGGCEGLNQRLEAYYNEGKLLPVAEHQKLEDEDFSTGLGA